MNTAAFPVYSVADIGVIESSVMPTAVPPLMERAGQAAAQVARGLIGCQEGAVLIVCGPGNNGGDGFVVARLLRQADCQVVVVFAGEAERLPPDAAKAYADFIAAGGQTVSDLPATPESQWALVVDALFGIGFKGALDERCAGWVNVLNALPVPRLALDVPSGLEADTGQCHGAVFCATHTATFIALKPGLLTLNGPDYCGEMSVHTLDIDPGLWVSVKGRVIHPDLFSEHLRPRLRNTHKGTYGDIGVLGGDTGMCGAALLAGRAALRLGGGRVFVALLDMEAPRVDLLYPELMLRRVAAMPKALTVLAIGPGLGFSSKVWPLLESALARPIPLVLDADALNLLGYSQVLGTQLTERMAPSILTPHPAEAARLLGVDTETVQADRLLAASELARRFKAYVVLKGCGSVVATPHERWYINTTGHPGMGAAGMGDVLTGLIASLLAQGWPAESALIAAVHLHGKAADYLAAKGVGPVGVSAGEVIDAARFVFNGWLKHDFGE